MMTRSDSPRPLPTVNVLDDLRESIDEAERRCNLSQRNRQIYGTWIFGFVCWCLRTPPNCVTPDRIESFRRSLDDQSFANPVDQQQVLNALGFFFGEVNVDDLDIRTSHPDLKGSGEELPFIYYNQLSSPGSTPLSPVQEQVDDMRSASDELLVNDAKLDVESPAPA